MALALFTHYLYFIYFESPEAEIFSAYLVGLLPRSIAFCLFAVAPCFTFFLPPVSSETKSIDSYFPILLLSHPVLAKYTSIVSGVARR